MRRVEHPLDSVIIQKLVYGSLFYESSIYLKVFNGSYEISTPIRSELLDWSTNGDTPLQGINERRAGKLLYDLYVYCP